MTSYKLTVRGDERVAFVGKTGSGKTFAALHLCRDLRRLVVCDPKGTIDVRKWRLQPYDIGRERNPSVQEFAEGKAGRFLLRAPIRGVTRYETWEEYLGELWEIGRLTLYIDEVYGVQPVGSKPGDNLSAFYTRGREREVGTWAATQRPAWVPMFTLSEAEWLFVFRLQLAKDRSRMVEMIGPAVEQRIPDIHGLWLYNALWDRPLYAPSLNIGPSDIAADVEQGVAQEALVEEAKGGANIV